MNHSIVDLAVSDKTHAVSLAWEEFVETGQISNIAPRSVISESWLASREQGIDPYSERAKSVISSDELELRLNKDDLGRAGKNVLDKIGHMAEGSEHIIVLANAQGQIIYSVGHDAVQSKLERINFMPGGDWSTQRVGPNGVGTPIALDRPELIFGSEHYCEAWHPWVCYGSPIHDNVGNVVGGIDITGPARTVKTELLSLAISTAHSIESGLSLLSLQRMESLRSLYRNKKMLYRSDNTLLVDTHGFIQDADVHFARIFNWDGAKMWDLPLSGLNKKLWSLIEKSIRTQQKGEYEYHSQNDYHGIKVMIEPLQQYDKCLGAIIIIDPAIQCVIEPYDFEQESELPNRVTLQSEDLKSQSDQMIRETLKKTNGNISKAARILGINRTTIYRRLELLKR